MLKSCTYEDCRIVGREGREGGRGGGREERRKGIGRESYSLYIIRIIIEKWNIFVCLVFFYLSFFLLHLHLSCPQINK